MKRGLRVGLAVLMSVCMAVTCVPASALAIPEADVSGESPFVESGAGTGTAATYINGVVYDAGAFRIASVDNDVPVTGDRLGEPVTVVVANGKGDPSGWSVKWSRQVLGEDGKWTDDSEFSPKGAGLADPSVDGTNAFLTYDFSKDADSFAAGDCRYRYFVEVSDGSNTDSTYPDDPIEVWPHESRYSNDMLTDTGRLGVGEWDWRFDGTHLTWASLNADGLTSADDTFGVLSNYAIGSGMTIRASGGAGDGAGGEGTGRDAAWILSVTTDSGEETDMFVGTAQVALDATEWVGDFAVSSYASEDEARAAAVAAAKDLKLLRTMDGKTVRSIGWAGTGNSASDTAFEIEPVVVGGKVHVLLKYVVEASLPEETGRLGCVALAGPKKADETVVIFDGSAAAVGDGADEGLPTGCSISPLGEQRRSSGQSMKYTIDFEDGWRLKGYVVGGREVVEGEAASGGVGASGVKTACVEAPSGQMRPIGSLGSNFIEIEVDKLLAAWAAAGSALASGSKVSVVAHFEKVPQPPIPPEPVVKGPMLKISKADHGYVEVAYFAAKLDAEGKPVLDSEGNVSLEKKTVDTKEGGLSIDDIMPGTGVTLKFCPDGSGQYVAGRYDDGKFVHGEVLVDGDVLSLTDGAVELANYGLDDEGKPLEGEVSIDYAFGPRQDEPETRYTVRAQVIPGDDGAVHGSATFEGTDDTEQGDVLAGSRVVFDVRPDSAPAPGYVLDKVFMVQHAEGVTPDTADGEDVTRHVSGGKLTIDSLSGVQGKGDVFSFLFRFKVAPVTLTVPDGLGLGGDGESLGTVTPLGKSIIAEGGEVRVVIAPASGSELNPDVQLMLRGESGRSVVILPSELEQGHDGEGNLIYMLPVGYDEAVGLGGQVELAVQNGPLFREKTIDPDPVYYEVTAEAKFESADGVKGAGAVSLAGGAEKVEPGGKATLYLMPEAGSKVVGVRIVDTVNGKERVRDFGSQPLQAVIEFPIANVVSDTHVTVTFAPVGDGESQGGLAEDQADVITVCPTSEIVGEGEIVSPEPGSVLTLPRGASQDFVFKPADGWKVGRVVLGGELVDGKIVGGTVLARGVTECTYRAVGGVKGVLRVEFVENAAGDGPEKPEVEVVDAEVQIVDVRLGVGGSMTKADFDKYVSVDIPKHRVNRGESVSFTLTLKDVKGEKGYFALYDVVAKDPATGVVNDGVEVTPLKGDAARFTYSPFGASGDVGTSGHLSRTVSLRSSSLIAAPAGEYLVTISNVRSNLEVEMQIAEMDPDSDDPEISGAAETKPSERGVPDWFTLTAASEGGGYVLPLYASWNSGVAEAERPGMKVHDIAGDDAARYVEFEPFAGSYLKSVYVQQGSYDDRGKWVAARGETGKAVNVFSRVMGNKLDVREVFDVLDAGRGAHVRLLATFAQVGDERETVSVTWGGAFAADGGGEPSSTKLNCVVTPSLGAIGHATALPINKEQTFIFDVPGTTSEAPHGWMLDYVLVNGEKRLPLPGKNYVTLPMDTDVEIVAVFRPAEEGEKPEPPLSYEMAPEQPDEGGAVLIGGSANPVSVVAGQSQTVDFKADSPTKDYEWILDEVTLDGVSLVPWDGGQALPDGFAFDPTTGEGVTAAGERFVLDYGSGTLTIDGVMRAHRVGAAFARAVDLRVTCDTESGLVTPRGSFKWRVGVERTADGSVRKGTDGREVLVPEKLTVYVAPYEGNELSAFEVNGVDGKDALASPADGKDALSKLKSEHKALQGGSSGTHLGIGANWVAFAADAAAAGGAVADGAAAGGATGVESPMALLGLAASERAGGSVPEFGDIQAYELTASDLTRNGKRVTTVKASFETSQEENTYTVKATVLGGHGKVNGQDSVTLSEIPEGDTAYLRLSPDAGYVVKQVRDNREVRTDFTSTGYTITDVREDHEVEIVFGLPNTPGSSDAVSKTIRRIGAMAKTGDLALPLMFVALGVALAAAGVAVIVGKRRRD